MKSFSKRIYHRLRPFLYDLGILHLARRLTSDDRRQRIATKLGLEGFNRAAATGRSLPSWVKKGARHGFIFDGVNIVGDLQADFGVSEVTRQTLNALQAAHIPTAYQEALYAPQSRTQPLPVGLKSGPQYSVNLIDIHFAHFYDTVMETPPHIFENKFNIAYWGWELPKFPPVSRRIFDLIDEIWVYSHYVQDSIGQASPVPVVRMPPAINAQASGNATRADFNLPENKKIFLFTFSPASMIARKNPFAVIDAFRLAFGTSSREAALVIKTHHLDLIRQNKQFKEDLQTAIDSVGGIMLHDNLSRQQIIDLLWLSDCYVSLHRAEGFGLGMAEAMALGKPVIAPHYSGNADFMNNSNSYGVRYSLCPIEEQDHIYQPEFKTTFEIGQLWAKPDIEHAAELMQNVVHNPKAAELVGELAKDYMNQYFSPEAIGSRIEARLRILSMGQ